MFNLIISRISKNTKVFLPILTCLLLLFTVFSVDTIKAMAQNLTLTNPSSVLLSQVGARINVETEITVNNQTNISFALPYQAEDLTLSVNGISVPQWRTSGSDTNNLNSKAHREYTSLINSKIHTVALMHTIKTSISLWENLPSTAMSIAELNKMQTALEKNIPDLQKSFVQESQRYDKIKEELADFPKITHRTKIIEATIPASLATAKTLKLSYSYSLNNCGWQAQYQFNAMPEKNSIQVSLFAKIQQYSGLDWKNAQVTLLPVRSKNIKPRQLYPWYVSSMQESDTVYANRMSSPPMLLSATAKNSQNDISASTLPLIQENVAFTSYNLNKINIDEGDVAILLNEDTWNSKMLWLARPSISSDVWLTVKHKLANVSTFPAGNATFLIDDVLIGNGSFKPVGDEVTLYFGVDPRLNVKSVANMLISGKEGFIDKTKTWDWAWNYTVYNGRKSPATIRIEEAAPQLGSKDFTVEYKGKPAPQKGLEHTLFWDITVPAEKSAIINHAVTIKAPNEVDINSNR